MNKIFRNIKILATGCYIPPHQVTSATLDQKLQKPAGYIERFSGVKTRRYITTETAAEMGAMAALAALQAANLTIKDIDCIVATSGTMGQSIPCNAVMIKQRLDCINHNIPAFDINATCLSFIVGVDLLADAITLGKYKNVLLVSSDIASTGLNWEQLESSVLFGDGAAAAILTQATAQESSQILGAYFENYVAGANFAQISGCGSYQHPTKFTDLASCIQASLFNMDGRSMLELTSKHVLPFIEHLYKMAGVTGPDDIKLLIPHQINGIVMRKICEAKLQFKDKYMYILPEYGNQIAVSIPMALHLAITNQRIQRGDKILLFGAGAGVSLGGIIMVY